MAHCRGTAFSAERRPRRRTEGGWSAGAGAEELLAVVVADQEGGVGQIGAELGQVGAIGADESAEWGGERRVVDAAEPLVD